jgi:cytochrome c biogenesis protein CcmG/thiol:disulfide interchange protein DsbE
MEVKDTQTLPGDNTHAEKLTAKSKGSRKRRIIIFTIVSLLNLGLLALLWSQLLTPAQNQASTGGDASGPLQGHPAPNFTLAALGAHGASAIDLASFKGKPIVLNFWASSCAPCHDEAPMLQTTWQHVQSKGVVFIGIDFQDARSDGLSFLQKYAITYPNALDADGSTAIHYGVTYTPTTFFINRQGLIVRSIPREMTAQELQTSLQLF